jgi:hypothetical protein
VSVCLMHGLEFMKNTQRGGSCIPCFPWFLSLASHVFPGFSPFTLLSPASWTPGPRQPHGLGRAIRATPWPWAMSAIVGTSNGRCFPMYSGWAPLSLPFHPNLSCAIGHQPVPGGRVKGTPHPTKWPQALNCLWRCYQKNLPWFSHQVEESVKVTVKSIKKRTHFQSIESGLE